MKKSILLMAGLLAMALAGSAQAATMFAVQDAGANDKMVVQDTGWIGIGTIPTGPVHFKGAGPAATDAGFIYEFTATGAAPPVFSAPNFFFTRNNDVTVNGGFPRINDNLGSISFGDVKAGSRISSAIIAVKAEANGTAAFTPSFITFTTTDTAGTPAARMRITSGGNIGIGTAAPTSKLHVVGIPGPFANNAAAIAGGLTAGAFYRTGADPDVLCVVH